VYNGTCIGTESNPGASIHITVGTAGIGYDVDTYRDVPWSRSRYATVYAYANIQVLGAHDLVWQLVDSVSGAVLDEAVIHSLHALPPP
jgi:hypothetical protein